MKIARFLMFVFACVLIPATAIDAEAVYESKGFEYTVSNEGTATITRYSGTESVLVVPSDLDGYTVTVIDDDAFSSCEGLVMSISVIRKWRGLSVVASSRVVSRVPFLTYSLGDLCHHSGHHARHGLSHLLCNHGC